jgi:Copine
MRLSASDLVGAHGLTPNAFVVLFVRHQRANATWDELARSEDRVQEASPRFARIFATEYHFELYQELRVCVFDKTMPGDDLKVQYLIGVADTSVGEVVAAYGQPVVLSLMSGQQSLASTVSLTAEEVMDAKKELTLEIGLRNLMTENESQEQRAYLDMLQAQLRVPSSIPELKQRPAAAVMRLIRKDKNPAVRSALVDNIANQEDAARKYVQSQIDAVQHIGPRPFRPLLTIYSAPASATLLDDWNSPEIKWTKVVGTDSLMQYEDTEEGQRLAPFTVSQMDLNGGDDNRRIRFVVFCALNNGGVREVGSYVTSVSALKATYVEGRETVLHLAPGGGSLILHRCEERVLPSFLDMLKESAFDLGLVVGIDFTQSNGPANLPSSLHYQPLSGTTSRGPNPYEAAIQSVANLLSAYSSDARIASYGFGAKVPPAWEVSHCFSLTGDKSNPLCDNVSALIEQYRKVLPKIAPWGPTMFSELLMTVGTNVARRVTAVGTSGTKSLPYTVLLIITDGVLSDFNKTTEELIKLSAAPLSIIIIGVGNEDFAKMRSLDDSKEPLRRGNEVAVRRFVQFADFASFATGEAGQIDLALLNAKLLGALPEQIVSYEQCGNSRMPKSRH